MRYYVTFACTLFGLALVLFNASGYDPHNIFLFMLSVPVWFVELFTDIHRVSVVAIYALTVASWAVIGYLCDRVIARDRAARQK